MSKAFLLKSFFTAIFISSFIVINLCPQICFSYSFDQQNSFYDTDSKPIQSKFKNEPSAVKGQVARIMFAGLGGAVFGVSTLSFYDRPQNHLSNVAVGTIIGLLIGSIYVTSESWETPDHEYSFKNIKKTEPEFYNNDINHIAHSSPIQVSLQFSY